MSEEELGPVWIHASEAAELRRGVEELMNDLENGQYDGVEYLATDHMQQLLDRFDAGDALARLKARQAKKAARVEARRGRRKEIHESMKCPVTRTLCKEHGCVHGLEAEELRRGIEKLISDCGDDPMARHMQRVLDHVDAGDSLAHLEAMEAKAPPPPAAVPAPADDWLTVEDAAMIANRSPTTIWRWAQAGLVKKSRRLGRAVFLRRDVERVGIANGDGRWVEGSGWVRCDPSHQEPLGSRKA